MGILLGGIMSVLTAKLTLKFQRDFQEKNVKNFCLDTVESINEFSTSLEEYRARTGVIYLDILTLIEFEIQSFYKNKEHLIAINKKLSRKTFKEYMNKVAIATAGIRGGLNRFYQLSDGVDPNSEESKQKKQALDEAHNSCVRLVSLVRAENSRILDILK